MIIAHLPNNIVTIDLHFQLDYVAFIHLRERWSIPLDACEGVYRGLTEHVRARHEYE